MPTSPKRLARASGRVSKQTAARVAERYGADTLQALRDAQISYVLGRMRTDSSVVPE